MGGEAWKECRGQQEGADSNVHKPVDWKIELAAIGGDDNQDDPLSVLCRPGKDVSPLKELL